MSDETQEVESAAHRPLRLTGQEMRGREGRPYVASSDLLAAANAALVLEMPLLLTGEAGCGKTDFAFAAASDLLGPKAKPLECYVRSDSRARDLLYHYDSLNRFGDAQFGQHTGHERAQSPRPYLRLEPLGRALMSPRLEVVLIDEIDKAPRDLPNDLLRELEQGEFEIREIPQDEAGGPAANEPMNVDEPATFRRTMRRPEGQRKPLLIITSNVERQLPDPFLRRCVFFHISFPGEKQLQEILSACFLDPDRKIDAEVTFSAEKVRRRRLAEPLLAAGGTAFLDQVIKIFLNLRTEHSLTKNPATAELIAWTEALLTFEEPATLRRWLGPDGKPPSFDKLPLLSCLIKLREDLDRLKAQSQATTGSA